MLKIIKQDTPVELGPLKVAVLGLPGLGKTTFALTSKNPLLIDCSCEQAWRRAMWRADALVEAKSWDDIVSMEQADLKGFDTVVIDTVGEMVNLLIQKVMKENKVNSVGGHGKEISQKGWGAVKAQAGDWLRTMRTYGKDVVFVCHVVEKAGRAENQNQYRVDVGGSTKEYIYQICDLMGLLITRNDKRWFLVKATDEAFGKSPVGVDNLELPNYETSQERDTLAKMMERTKIIFERKNELGAKLNASLDKLRSELDNQGVETDEERQTTADYLTNLAAKSTDENWTEQHKQVVWIWANEKGFGYSAPKRAFLPSAPKTAPAPAQAAPAQGQAQ